MRSTRVATTTLALLLLPGVLLCRADETPSGVRLSFKAGGRDARGQPLGGTELIHLVAHAGRLYGANGYWEDSAAQDSKPGSQVLVLDEPGAEWRVDLAFGRGHVRTAALAEVTFGTDGKGAALSPPVCLLLAVADGPGGQSKAFARDDATDTWTEMVVGRTDRPSLARSAILHRDRVTGVDRVFLGCSPTNLQLTPEERARIDSVGIVSGVFDREARGRIRWDAAPELPARDFEQRVMAFAEANGVLYAVANTALYRRTDGAKPSWDRVYTSSAGPIGWKNSGLRGLTAIPKPGGGEVLLVALEGAKARILRLDPSDGFQEHQELDVLEFLGKKWGARPIYSIPAYDAFTPVVDPASHETLHLIGLEASFSPRDRAGRATFHGFEPDGWFLVRHADGRYDLRHLAAPGLEAGPGLLAVRTICPSPFAAERGRALYFGGFDCNFIAVHDTAWVLRADVAAVLSGGR